MRQIGLTVRVALAALMLSGAIPVTASLENQAAAPRPQIFVEDSTSQSLIFSLAKRMPPSSAIPLGARVRLTRDDKSIAALGRYLDATELAQLPVWIVVSAPASLDEAEPWRSTLRQLFTRHPQTIAIVEVEFDETPANLQRFVLELTATESRASGVPVVVAASGTDAPAAQRFADQLTGEQSPYLDGLVVHEATGAGALEVARRRLPALNFLRRARASRPADVVRATMAALATETMATAWTADPDDLAQALVDLAPAAALLSHAVQQIAPASVGLTVMAGPENVERTLTHRLLFDADTFTTYLWYDGGVAGASLETALRLPVGGSPAVFNLATGRPTAAAHYVREEDSAVTRVTLPLTGGSMLVDFSAGGELLADRTTVTAASLLSVQEVIARHRRQQTRQDALLRHYRAHVRMEQHFRPTLTDPGYDVVTENEYFVEGGTVEWEEHSFSVNGSKWGADRPAFPLLQAEKVLSLPLELRLNEDYRYALDGVERVGESECYRVRFEPTSSSAALYRGTVWIDRRSFAKRRVQVVQTRTAAPVVSNEEIHTYDVVGDIGGVPIALLTQQTARLIVLIAGRNLLLEKTTRLTDFRLNEDGFLAAREAARQGQRIMYRDTDVGVRYLVKEGDVRVVSQQATSHAKAMAMGLLVDPSFAFPLPIFGINYLDFEVQGRTDTQFALLFGGVLAAGNLQRPRIGGTPLDASLDFFGIAVPATDRLQEADGERVDERLLTWPLSGGVNLGWQYTAFQKASLQYQLRFDPFVRDRTTAESFVVPSSTVTHGIGAAWDYRRGGYSAAVNATVNIRASWSPWGPAGALETGGRTYAKYSGNISKDFFLSTFQKVHLNGAYFGGHRLDRFSRYQFGLFDDTRIHGVPGSGVRFDELGMVRASYSFNIFEQYRLDLFVDQAWGVDRAVDPSWRPLTGIGAAVNLRAPFNTILRADGGKSFLPSHYAQVGSVVFQVMILKPLS